MSIRIHISNIQYEILSDIKKTFYKINIKDMCITLPFFIGKSIKNHCEPQNTISKLIFKGTLHKIQKEKEQEILWTLNKYYTCILSMPPGFGKTVLLCKIITKLDLKTCILVSTFLEALCWEKMIEKLTNAKVWIVHDKYPPSEYDICICLPTLYKKIPKEIRNNIGLLIISEVHKFYTQKHFKILLSFHPKYLIAESCTPQSSTQSHDILNSLCGNIFITEKELDLNIGG